MSVVPAHRLPDHTQHRDWVGMLLGAVALVVAGVVIGMQYVEPNKRVIQVLAAIVVFGIAWRLNMTYAIGFLLLVLPYPKATSFGNSNLALVGLVLVIWLLRFTTRQAERPQRTPLDVPIIGLLIAYIVSFYNVDLETHLLGALSYFFVFASCLAVYYLIVSNVRTLNDLRIMHTFQLVSMLLIMLVAMWEAFVPGRPLIPGWIEFKHDITEGARAHDIRVGGAFGDYELLAEYCGINLFFLLFMINQHRSTLARTALLGLLGLVLLVLFSTVTRGALIAVTAAFVYFGFLIRRRLKVVPLTVGLGLSLAGVLSMDWYVSNFTNAGSVLDRLMGTRFEGLVPDTRASVWPQAVERWLRHPLIGSGPYYLTERGLETWLWPHNLVLFVLNTVGVLGFCFFAWLLWKVWRLSTPPTDDPGSRDYAGSYLLMAHVMLVVFLVDELKIEYLRNLVYPYQVWILFATIVAAHQVHRREQALRPVPAPAPGRR